MKKLFVSALIMTAVGLVGLGLANSADAAGCGCGGEGKCKTACGQKGQACQGGGSAIQAAIEAKDFTAWQTAMAAKTCPNKPELTREVFDRLVKAHELRQSGQVKEAAQLGQGLKATKPSRGGACHLKGAKQSGQFRLGMAGNQLARR